MQKKLFVYSAFIAIMMLSGCTLEPLDAYEGTPCPNVHRLITKIDYGLPNGTHVEVYCGSSSIDSHADGTCDDYITHDFIDDTVSHDAEGQMIFALNSGLCPKSYLCQDNGTCVKSLCNGFNANLDSDNANCGKCGYKCGNGTTCSNGVCIVADKSKVLCNGEFINPENDPRYCGASGDCKDDNPVSWNYRGRICQGATPVCSKGRCVSACVGGQIVCDGRCVDPQTDMNYCGARGDCFGFNAGEKCADGRICSGGSCGVTCVSGQIVCGGRCVDPMTDNAYCGATGNCNDENAGERCTDGRICSGGSCGVTCVSGQILCHGRCIDPTTDNRYCGARGDCKGGNAGETCTDGRICSGGTCNVTCVSGQILCHGQCIDPSTDNRYCGASGNCIGANSGSKCKDGEVCSGGTCGASCLSGQVLCGGKCILPETDNTYCGAKGKCNNTSASSNDYKGATCASGEVCSGGTCGASCLSGQVLCGGKCIVPETDNAYCGAKGKCNSDSDSDANYRGKACTNGTKCSEGRCVVTCTSNQIVCGEQCVEPSSSKTNCGAKGKCNNPNVNSQDYQGALCDGDQVCAGGKCVQNSCVAPLVLCSTTAGNQCVDINETDENNCGTCGYKCADHPVANAVSEKCIDGLCIYECKLGYANKGTGDTASEILCVDSAL